MWLFEPFSHYSLNKIGRYFMSTDEIREYDDMLKSYVFRHPKYTHFIKIDGFQRRLLSPAAILSAAIAMFNWYVSKWTISLNSLWSVLESSRWSEMFVSVQIDFSPVILWFFIIFNLWCTHMTLMHRKFSTQQRFDLFVERSICIITLI